MIYKTSLPFTHVMKINNRRHMKQLALLIDRWLRRYVSQRPRKSTNKEADNQEDRETDGKVGRGRVGGGTGGTRASVLTQWEIVLTVVPSGNNHKIAV